MELANTPAYYDRAKITAVKSFITQAPALRKIAESLFGKKKYPSIFFPSTCEVLKGFGAKTIGTTTLSKMTHSIMALMTLKCLPLCQVSFSSLSLR
jgi:hypothetical protein